jgi:hypothetical protein
MQNRERSTQIRICYKFPSWIWIHDYFVQISSTFLLTKLQTVIEEKLEVLLQIFSNNFTSTNIMVSAPKCWSYVPVGGVRREKRIPLWSYERHTVPEEGETVWEEGIVFLKPIVHQNHIGRQLFQQRTLCNTYNKMMDFTNLLNS